jgi:hypothetical protein
LEVYVPSQSAAWGQFRWQQELPIPENRNEKLHNPFLVVRGLLEWSVLLNRVGQAGAAVESPPGNALRAEWAAAGLVAGLRAGQEWA